MTKIECLNCANLDIEEIGDYHEGDAVASCKEQEYVPKIKNIHGVLISEYILIVLSAIEGHGCSKFNKRNELGE